MKRSTKIFIALVLVILMDVGSEVLMQAQDNKTTTNNTAWWQQTAQQKKKNDGRGTGNFNMNANQQGTTQFTAPIGPTQSGGNLPSTPVNQFLPQGSVYGPPASLAPKQYGPSEAELYSLPKGMYGPSKAELMGLATPTTSPLNTPWWQRSADWLTQPVTMTHWAQPNTMTQQNHLTEPVPTLPWYYQQPNMAPAAAPTPTDAGLQDQGLNWQNYHPTVMLTQPTPPTTPAGAGAGAGGGFGTNYSRWRKKGGGGYGYGGGGYGYSDYGSGSGSSYIPPWYMNLHSWNFNE